MASWRVDLAPYDPFFHFLKMLTQKVAKKFLRTAYSYLEGMIQVTDRKMFIKRTRFGWWSTLKNAYFALEIVIFHGEFQKFRLKNNMFLNV